MPKTYTWITTCSFTQVLRSLCWGSNINNFPIYLIKFHLISFFPIFGNFITHSENLDSQQFSWKQILQPAEITVFTSYIICSTILIWYQKPVDYLFKFWKKKKNQGRKMLVASLLRVWHFITTYNWLFKPYFTYSKKSILFFSLFSKYFFLLTFFLFSFWFFFHFSLFNKMKKRNFKKIQTSKLNHKSVCFGLYLC